MKLHRIAIVTYLVAVGAFVACSETDEPFGDGSEDEDDSVGGFGTDDSATDDDGISPPGSGGSSSSGHGGDPSGGGGEGPAAGGRGEGGMGPGSSTGSGTRCAHDFCTEGVALDVACDPCVGTLCAIDSFCCDTEWDATCVDEVERACGLPPCQGGTGGSGGGGAGGGEVGVGDLVITEIMNNPKIVADADGEWFEIHNASASTLDLGGLVIRHQEGDPAAVHTIAGSVSVPSGGYVVLGVNGDTATNGGITHDYVWPANTINLANTTDLLAVELADGTVIDQTNWTELSGLDPDGASRNLDSASIAAATNDDDSTFCAATTVIAGSTDKGTPGAPNDPCN